MITSPTKLSTVLYVRWPGLLATALRENRSIPAIVPVVIAAERVVRDVCPLAARQGISVGESIVRARRLCPASMVVPLEDVSLGPLSFRVLEPLASVSPHIEPDGPDAVYVGLTDCPTPDIPALLAVWRGIVPDFSPLVGLGPSRIAARACAECGLPADRLPEAKVRWLWPEDEKITNRLFRLGLSNFGEVAALGESALVYQFGKLGRLLHQCSIGRDLTPIRALWPPPLIALSQDFALEPIENEGYLWEALQRLATRVSEELCAAGRYARRLRLSIDTERGKESLEWVLPAPVQKEREIATSLWRLRQQMMLTAGIVRIQVVAENLDLPPASTASLFDNRSAERRLALAATRQRLHARFGIRSLRTLAELPISKREIRRELWKARQQA